jgi:hypothetical protein
MTVLAIAPLIHDRTIGKDRTIAFSKVTAFSGYRQIPGWLRFDKKCNTHV